MATHTYTLNAAKSTEISAQMPSANNHAGLNATVDSYFVTFSDSAFLDNSLLIGFNDNVAEIESALVGKIVTSAKIKIYFNSIGRFNRLGAENGTIGFIANVGAADFNEATVTYESRPLGGAQLPDTVFLHTINFVAGYYSFKIPSNYLYLSFRDILTYAQKCTRITTKFTNEAFRGTANIDTSRGANPPIIEIVTEDSVPTGTPISPQNNYIDNTALTNLRWSYANEGGGNQKSYVIQYKDASHTAWTELVGATSAATEYEVEANFFSAGEVQWRVKVVSEYDIESDWSTAATFIAQGAPLAPAIIVDVSPRPQITWTGLGQRAYEVAIDTDMHRFFGTAQTYTVKNYLTDGDITVGVRIQNEFGLWSAWSQQTITIVNTAGDGITLSVQAADKARLSWTETEHPAYYVYRDDVPIAKTGGTTYTDHLAIGRHTYKVRGADGNNYSMSNAVTCTMRVDCPMIAALDTLAWLKLRCSTSPERALGLSAGQDVTYQYYAGRSLPLAETGGRISKNYNFNVAFSDPADATTFEAMLGKTVAYKDHHGRIFIGPLMAYESSIGLFFAEYSCTIVQTDNREAVDYD